jgi:hypothetical protein
MEMDDQDQSRQSREHGPQEEGRAPALKWAALALALATIATATGFLTASWLRPRSEETPTPPAEPIASERLFRNWPKPDVALALTGQQFSYLQPCGCSPVQLGGLARRYNFFETLKKRGWPVVAADLGDVAQEQALPQKQLKYKHAMEGHKRLGYRAVGLGENELLMPLFDAIGSFALNEPSPRVLCANLAEKENNFPNIVLASEVTEGKNNTPRVGFLSVVGPAKADDLQKRSGNDVRFEPLDKVLPREIQALQQKQAEVLVLLFQGNAKEAKSLAARYPQFQVILCCCEQEEPSSQPGVAGNTLIIGIGHKGRYVGVVGVNRTGRADRPFELRYELVDIGPQYETPQGQEAMNPLHKVLDDYALEVQKGNYLAKYLQVSHPMQIAHPGAAYVGSDKCKRCHTDAYEVWQNHPHSHAYKTLVDAKRPALRQFDGECIVCHTVGFQYLTGFRNEQATPKLLNVGCESCHGPASLHAQNPDDEKLREALNPWKLRPGEDAQKLALRIETTVCLKCHDLDNSVNFKFDKYWFEKKTIHHTPKNE